MNPNTQPGDPSIPPELGVSILEEQLYKGRGLCRYEGVGVEQNKLAVWMNTTRACLEKAFGSNSRNVEDFLAFGEKDAKSYYDDGTGGNYRRKLLESKLTALEGYIEELRMDQKAYEERRLAEEQRAAEERRAAATRPPIIQPALSKKIFIVHGHDGELKEATARLVSQLDLEPVILHEQPRQGRTIIENFSIHAKASGFAIVLLTADDVGSVGTVEEHAQLQRRARQNVVFEMGFFFGSLGQGKVCAVHDAGVEMPSDLGGILYIPYDGPSGRWRWDIAREIRAAGHEIDLNKL